MGGKAGKEKERRGKRKGRRRDGMKGGGMGNWDEGDLRHCC